ncbi:PaaX family transcriptional regulator [Brevibacterium sp. UCMA 11754]|uniref:PaaX family transcriptional regulator n=1 Tax=Brevibacterium sp. UCMA 11754 TaxID=2749198 RepID=UPI001F1C307C|nr:PaaX family transcriptional regulator C-terminal domain-containing protein [Brevibacterium sp. UCMA 11754]MCF2571228.1 PaaX family transcriptional regulator [Brevibacterium sp. UCMA 11754]
MTVHPQSLFFALAGLHMLDDPRPLSGTSIVFVMGRLGVGESAARSVLQRMAAKKFIVRHKEGRKTFYTLSDRGRAILREGQEKMFAGWQPQDWDGRWTFVRIQVPESKRTLRHQMASRLSWAGFAQVDGGPWVAPGQHDVVAILGPEHSEISPIVVYGMPQPPTTDEMLVSAFDLEALAADYEAFGEKWRAVVPASLSSVEALVRRVELHFDWLTLTRTDPQLPGELLPEVWPGTVQNTSFRVLDSELSDREASAVSGFFGGGLSEHCPLL